MVLLEIQRNTRWAFFTGIAKDNMTDTDMTYLTLKYGKTTADHIQTIQATIEVLSNSALTANKDTQQQLIKNIENLRNIINEMQT